MNNNFNLNTFYILSGVSASGKSTLTNDLLSNGWPKEGIISTDKLRENILGSFLNLDENGIKETLFGWELEGNRLFDMVETMLDMRLKQKLPTLIDATSLMDSDRARFVKIAEKNGVESEIVIFDVPLEELKKRLSNRKQRFDLSVLDKQMSHFQKDSMYPFRIYKNTKVNLIENNIDTLKIDVVGDTHGMLLEVKDLFEQIGWSFDLDSNSFKHQDPERKLLFLGDIVDRGLYSVELLEVVKNTVDNGNAIIILGNHEEKLLNNYENWIKNGKINGKSISSSETFLKFLELKEDKQLDLYKFLKFSPIKLSLVINKENQKLTTIENYSNPNNFNIGFAHANNVNYNPFNMPKSFALYGSKSENYNTDLKYQENYEEGINLFTLIRGHIPNISPNNNIYSLDDRQAFAGNLVVLPLDIYVSKLKENNWISSFDLFENSVIKLKTNYNYDVQIKSKVDSLVAITDYEKKGLLIKNTIPESLSDIGYKFFSKSPKLYFVENDLFKKEDAFVLDFVGNKVMVIKDLELLQNIELNDHKEPLYYHETISYDNLVFVAKNKLKNNFLVYKDKMLETNMSFSTELKNSLFAIFNDKNVTLLIDSYNDRLVAAIDNNTSDYIDLKSIQQISNVMIADSKVFDKYNYNKEKTYFFKNENSSFISLLKSEEKLLIEKKSLENNKEIQKIIQITEQFCSENNIVHSELEKIILHKKFKELKFLDKKETVINSIENFLKNESPNDLNVILKLKNKNKV